MKRKRTDKKKVEANLSTRQDSSACMSDMDFLPMAARRITMCYNTPKQKKDETKKMVKLCKKKLRAIDDPEANLVRSVLINNTFRRLKQELGGEKKGRYYGYGINPMSPSAGRSRFGLLRAKSDEFERQLIDFCPTPSAASKETTFEANRRSGSVRLDKQEAGKSTHASQTSATDIDSDDTGCPKAKRLCTRTAPQSSSHRRCTETTDESTPCSTSICDNTDDPRTYSGLTEKHTDLLSLSEPDQEDNGCDTDSEEIDVVTVCSGDDDVRQLCYDSLSSHVFPTEYISDSHAKLQSQCTEREDAYSSLSDFWTPRYTLTKLFPSCSHSQQTWGNLQSASPTKKLPISAVEDKQSQTFSPTCNSNEFSQANLSLKCGKENNKPGRNVQNNLFKTNRRCRSVPNLTCVNDTRAFATKQFRFSPYLPAGYFYHPQSQGYNVTNYHRPLMSSSCAGFDLSSLLQSAFPNSYVEQSLLSALRQSSASLGNFFPIHQRLLSAEPAC